MDKIASNKINILTFYLIFMVVLGHSYNLASLVIERERDVVYYIEYLFAYEISRAFIGMFFFISGYLFFYNHDFLASTFKTKIQKRFKTLVIPYVLWCSFWFLVVYTIQFVPTFGQFFEETLYEMPIWKQIWLAFVDPVNYPFWFIRELIFYVLLTPLIYLGIKYLKFFFLIALGVLIFLKQPSLLHINNINLFQFYGLFVFSCGAYAAIRKIKLVSYFKPSTYVLILVVWLAFMFLDFYVREIYQETYWLAIACKRVTMLIGFFAIWCIYDVLDRKYKFQNKSIYEYRFFIYAAHGIAMIYFTKIYVQLIGENDFALLLLFFAVPILATVVCIRFAKLMQKITPKVYSLITGSR